jgi:hypothetical protein
MTTSRTPTRRASLPRPQATMPSRTRRLGGKLPAVQSAETADSGRIKMGAAARLPTDRA